MCCVCLCVLGCVRFVRPSTVLIGGFRQRSGRSGFVVTILPSCLILSCLVAPPERTGSPPPPPSLLGPTYHMICYAMLSYTILSEKTASPPPPPFLPSLQAPSYLILSQRKLRHHHLFCFYRLYRCHKGVIIERGRGGITEVYLSSGVGLKL